MTNEFPKMLFKMGSAFEWEGRKLDSLLVHDAGQEAAAFDDGWLTSAMVLDADDAAPADDEAPAPRRGRPRKVA
jgi:hypothetical protein